MNRIIRGLSHELDKIRRAERIRRARNYAKYVYYSKEVDAALREWSQIKEDCKPLKPGLREWTQVKS